MKKVIMAVLLTMTLVLAIARETAHEAQVLMGIERIKNGSVNAVILGESIGASKGASNPLTTGWNSDLNALLLKKYSNYIKWDNKASGGNLVDYCLKRATEIVSTTDAVFICSGRIDRNFATPEEYGKKYTQLINEIKSQAPNADIFCIVEPPMVASDESLFLGIRSVIVKVSAQTGSNLLDVWSAFPQNQAALGALLADGLHPNDAGYKLMANYMYNRIAALIETEYNLSGY